MKAILLITRRELGAYLRSMAGYIIIALLLVLDGIFFNAYGLGGSDKHSSDVLRLFFEVSSALTAGACVFLSMRLVAEEKQTGTINLLYSSPIRDSEIVVGKYFSSFIFLMILLATTIYMPALIFVHGKVSFGHIAIGYLGLLLLGSGVLAIGTLGSALARTPLLALVTSSTIVVALYACVYVAQVADRPLSDLFSAFAYYPHFHPFETGVLHVRDVVFYVAVTYVALFSATRVLEARRWR